MSKDPCFLPKKNGIILSLCQIVRKRKIKIYEGKRTENNTNKAGDCLVPVLFPGLTKRTRKNCASAGFSACQATGTQGEERLQPERDSLPCRKREEERLMTESFLQKKGLPFFQTAILIWRGIRDSNPRPTGS